MAREFTREFKLEVCGLIHEGEVTKNAVGVAFGLSHGMMDRWVAQYEVLGEDAFTRSPWRPQVEEGEVDVQSLQEEVQVLRLHIAALQRKIAKLTRPKREPRKKPETPPSEGVFDAPKPRVEQPSIG